MSDSLQPHESQHARAFLSITNSWSSLRLTSMESVMPSSHLILCHPLLLLPPIPPSIRVFSNEATLRMRWPKYWSFSFSIIPSKEIPGLISFRMDWLDLLAVQGTLRSLLQHHSSKASILRCSASGICLTEATPAIKSMKTVIMTADSVYLYVPGTMINASNSSSILSPLQPYEVRIFIPFSHMKNLRLRDF